ncbi:membrane lipoprotein lipid attachment site-containing protein [Solibacillus sp. CAU 1738]|uniref:membrane lipoprotein lipid attachment site-containing protein n=1 Tax=Solibacillus sp. CAU 1738 TaxID=3140363 RepID=UPI00326100EF
MKRILVYLSLMFILVGCSNENGDNSTKEVDITKAFVEENAEVGLTYSEVRERFGTELLADVVDNTETWLYDSTQYSGFEYDKSLEVVSFDEIKSGNLEYQLYINFIEEEAFMYSYFYLGEDGKVWQYQIIPNSDPLNIPVSL